jgi:hypothetical protein
MKRSIRAILSALVIGLCFTLPNAAIAGTTGVVSGYVHDRSGRPLSGAGVVIFNLRDPDERRFDVNSRTSEFTSTTTNARGYFVFISLQPGHYLVRSRLAGEFLYCPPRVIVDADQSTFVSISMVDRGMLVVCSPPRYTGPGAAAW